MKKRFIKSHSATSYGVYVVHAKTFDYDEYDEITVIANSEANAKEEVSGFFMPHQFPLSVKKICSCDAKSTEVLTTSYNAG